MYRLIGPKRSIEEAYRIVSGAQALSGKRPGQAWYQAAREWRWSERAMAWDMAERKRLREMDEDRRLDEREHRVRLIEQMMTMVSAVIGAANMAAMTEEEARELLPMMRLFMRDLLREHRTELGLPTMHSGDEDGGVLPFTADELLAAQRAMGMARMSMEMASVQPEMCSALDTRQLYMHNLSSILASLYPEDVSARRVAEQSGLAVRRIQFSARAENTWHSIVQEAQQTARMENLIRVVSHEYRSNRELRAAVQGYRESNADED